MSRWSRSMSPAALLISVLALVVATSAGTAYAAVKIGTRQLKNNAVTTAKIKDGNVTSADLRDGGVTSADVANGSLGAGDLSTSARRALRGARAYATVDPSPSGGSEEFVPGSTMGFTAVDNPDTGKYCLTVDPALGLDLQKITVLTGLEEYGMLGVSSPRVSWKRVAECGAGRVQIRTFDGAAASDSVGFTVVIP